MSDNENYDEERNGLWFWIPLILILLVLFFIIRSCSNDEKLWQSSSNGSSTEISEASKKSLSDPVNSVKNKLANASDAVSGSAKSAANTLSDTASSVAGMAGETASKVGDATANAAKSATQAIGDVIEGAGNTASNTLNTAETAASSAVSKTSDTVSRLGTATSKIGGKIVDSGKNAAIATKDVTKKAASKALQSLKDIPDGVLNSDIANQLKAGGLVAGRRYRVGTLHFNSKESVISKADKAKLDAVVQIVQVYPTTTIYVHGHADSSGPEDFNQALSSQRANQAKQWLLNSGAPAEQIVTQGHGSRKPAAANDTPQGRRKNRRIEIEIQQ